MTAHPGIPFAAEIRELRYLQRKAAADYHSHDGPRVMPTAAERKTAVRAVQSGRITQREVAEILGVHPETVRNWLKAARKAGKRSRGRRGAGK